MKLSTQKQPKDLSAESKDFQQRLIDTIESDTDWLLMAILFGMPKAEG